MQATQLFESEVLSVIDCRPDQYMTHKDMPLLGNYHRADWAWALGKVGPRKTSERLSEFKDQFTFTVMMHNGHGLSRGTEAARKAAIEAGLWKKRDDRINIVLYNNVATEWNHVPLTPWMMFHRAAHCLAVTDAGKGIQELHRFEFLKEIFEKKPRGNPLDILGWEPTNVLQAFTDITLTNRANRECIMSSSADQLAELFAQHHLGGVRFLRVKDWEERISFFNTRKQAQRRDGLTMYPELRKMLENPEETDKFLGELENNYGKAFEAMKKDMVGKVYSF